MASRGINKVIIVGNLGQDPEVRYMPNGSAVANLTIATSESWKDKHGQQQEKTEWHKVVVFGKLAEIAGEYLRKGSQTYIEGKLQTRKWQDQQGQDRYSTEIVVDINGSMQMLDKKQDNNQGASPQQPQNAPQKPQNAPQQPQQGYQQPQGNQGRPQQPQQRPQQGYQSPNNGEFDDDIPFN